MEINRNNYEAFLMDLLEGRLSAEDRQRLDDFLLRNPDCAIEPLDAESLVLESEEVEFRNKERLRKSLPGTSTELNDHNFDLFSIARMEGDLTGEQEQAHQEMVTADPERSVEWIDWQQTRLIPRQTIYKGKGALKRKNTLKNRVIWMSIVSAAAALALLFVLFRSVPDLLPVEQAGSISPSSTRQTEENPEMREAPSIPEAAENQTSREAAEIREIPEETAARTAPEITTARAIPEETAARTTENETAPRQNIRELTDEPLREYAEPAHLASVRHLNEFSPAGGPEPDEIGSLDVQVVPVHLSSLSLAQLSDMDLQDFLDNYREEKNFSLWTIANAGINGINRLAGSEISLTEARDETGEVSGFQLKGKRFSLTRPIGR